MFGAGGTLVGMSATLLGQSRGDIPVPGAGQKNPSDLLPYERKTPAGRFESQPGRNLHGEPVVWVDYESGIAIHRVPGGSQLQRVNSLATEDPNNKRMSLGCVVVPEPFFLSVVLPTLGHGHGTVYVLPEDEPVQAMFNEPRSTPPSPRGARTSASALGRRVGAQRQQRTGRTRRGTQSRSAANGGQFLSAGGYTR